MSIDRIPGLIQQLYAIVDELEAGFPGRRFTPDGHLVGSIGEVLAAHSYRIRLYTASVETHDGESLDGRKVQVKATQGRSVGLRSEPEHLLVLSIKRNGSFIEVYNGPGSLAWMHVGKHQSNGQRTISVSRLRALMQEIPLDHQLIRYV